jgi:hypothetical protein
LGSQNGTWVDGQRAQGTKLSHNVCIVAGRTVFMFCEHHLHTGEASNPLAIPSCSVGAVSASWMQSSATARGCDRTGRDS